MKFENREINIALYHNSWIHYSRPWVMNSITKEQDSKRIYSYNARIILGV
jgi:hypothetical protein